MTTSGLFITLEGVEGAGKSTLMDYVAKLVSMAGREYILTREPGGTKTGEKIRAILLDNNNNSLSDDTELLLMFAARAQHIQQIIKPALKENKVVICDRFTDASYAYQGGGRGINLERIKTLEDWVQQGLQPDLTILFDLDVEIGLRRAGKRSEADRFEQEQKEFFERVRQCYLERAKIFSDRYRLIDSSKPLDDVKRQIETVFKEREIC